MERWIQQVAVELKQTLRHTLGCEVNGHSRSSCRSSWKSVVSEAQYREDISSHLEQVDDFVGACEAQHLRLDLALDEEPPKREDRHWACEADQNDAVGKGCSTYQA